MTEKTQKRLVALVAALLLAAVLACGCDDDTSARKCYSTYPGCEATAEAIEEAINR
jgi:hypothetical protein